MSVKYLPFQVFALISTIPVNIVFYQPNLVDRETNSAKQIH